MYIKRKKPAASNAINSAALQDHILRQFSFKSDLPKRSSFSRNAKNILKLAENDEITMKQIKYNAQLTLAQRLGLVNKPDKPLDHNQWAAVEKTSELREEYKGHCPICQEFLGREANVILSCSHVFHKQCITSFEKYSKTKACPICRKQSYEKKTYKTAQDYFYLFCIVKLQAWIRGFICREKFIKYMLKHKSRHVGVNRKYAELNMRRLNYKLNVHMDKRETKIDKMFEDLQKKLEDSQAAISALRNANRLKMERNVDIDWSGVKVKADCRADISCSICLQALEERRESTILSCSHVFHEKCIQSFENFSVKTPCCPVCRSEYVRTKY